MSGAFIKKTKRNDVTEEGMTHTQPGVPSQGKCFLGLTMELCILPMHVNNVKKSEGIMKGL